MRNRFLGGGDGRLPRNCQGQHDAGKQHGLTDRQDDHAVRRERRMIARLSNFVFLILVGHGACHPTSMRFDQAQ
jgi:hypothetical protein